MSKERKKWVSGVSREQLQNDPDVNRIAGALSLRLPTAQLLINRGCTDADKAKIYLEKGEENFYDSLLMKDMDKGAETIIDSVSKKEKIVIYGDYDVDGVTSVCVLYSYLKSKGADIGYFIPSRSGDGYGVSAQAVRKLREDGYDLMITVDTGVTAYNEIEIAKSIGLKAVITDHHECLTELPDAEAVINPKRPDCSYPFKELAGVGVAFKLICAIEVKMNPEDTFFDCVSRVAHEYCDLVAIGTISDIMPVLDENRLIVSYGLDLLNTTERPGISALMKVIQAEGKGTRKNISATFIGFSLAPRLNAAGRIREASIAVELLLSDNMDDAMKLAKEVCEINRERQDEENRITEEAFAKINRFYDIKKNPVIVLDDDSWHHGIIGIVASRITERYNCPAILISFSGSEDGKTGKGSGRSVKGLNLAETLGECSDLLIKYGGHELAAGLTIDRDKLAEFTERINEIARKKLTDELTDTPLEAECELYPSDLNLGQAEEVGLLEPFGTSNPVPLFLVRDMEVTNASAVGDGRHIRYSLNGGGNSITGMYFRKRLPEADIYAGDRVDMMFTLDVNEFLGLRSAQAVIRDIRLTDELYEAEKNNADISSAMEKGLYTDKNPGFRVYVPERNDFIAVYTALKRVLAGCVDETESFTIRSLEKTLAGQGCNVGNVKLRHIIKIFNELCFIKCKSEGKESNEFSVQMLHGSEKTALEKSKLYSRLLENYSGTEHGRK